MLKTLLSAAVVLGLSAGTAFAQSCAAPGSWTPDTNGTPTVTGDTCAGADDVALFCGGQNSTGKFERIYQVNFAAGYTATSVTLAGGAAGFDPVVYIYSGGCATGDGCVAAGDASAPMAVTGVNPGTYFLAVGAAPPDSAGACGTYTLTANGTFPVTLQGFSVE